MNKQRILLIGDKKNLHSLVSLAGIIEHTETGSVMNLSVEDPKSIRQAQLSPNDIIFCTFFSSQVPEIYTAIGEVGKKFPNTCCVAGGPHATGAPEQTLNAGFDYVIKGEGEVSIPQFLKMLKGQAKAPDIPGLSYIRDGKAVHNKNAAFIDLDNAFNQSTGMKTVFPIEITRGCPYSCHFCQVSSLFGRKYRHRSIESILSYVQKGQKFIRFVSPNAFAFGTGKPGTVNHARIVELLEAIKQKDTNIEIFFGSFPCEVRPEYVDNEIVRIVKQYTNNKTIAIGAQSGSNRLLKTIHRMHTIEDVFLAVENINRHGLKSKVDFIFGLPGETEEDIQATFEVIARLVKMNTEIRIHTFIPLPGTGFSSEAPGVISEQTKGYLLNLIGKGQASGPWKSKAEINTNLTSFYKQRQFNYS